MQDKYKDLIKIVKSSKVLENENESFLVNYIDDIRNERRVNDFFEFEFLKDVVLKLITTNLDKDFNTKFNDIISNIKFLLPLGNKTENYEFYKNLIINSDLVFDKEMYSLFENKLDYQQIINIIRSKSLAEEQYNLVRNYIIEISPYCLSNEHLKKEVISFINGLSSQIDYDEYYKNKIKKIEKRNGIYDIEEKKLSLISTEVEKATYLITKLEEMAKQIERYDEVIKEIYTKGIDNIRSSSKEELERISTMAKNSRIDLTNDLNEYILELEKTLKASSDNVFEEVLKEAQVQINEITKKAQNLTVISNTDILKLQRATDDCIQKLKNYINSDEVKQALSEIKKSEQAINNLASLNVKENTLEQEEVKQEIVRPIVKEVEEEKEETVSQQIKQYHKEVFPTIKLLGVKAPLIYSFDSRIPAKERFEKILELKQERENNGELFHQAFEEVVKCVMQGDYTYLYGPSGCGKSYLAKQVATILGLETTISDQVADQYGIKGYKDAQGNFQPTQAYDAFVKGKMLIVNEFDNSNSQAQVVLNTLYDALRDVKGNPYQDSYVTFADDVTVPINPNFRILCTGNTDLNGPNKVFQRTKSDGAVEKRIKFIELSYDNKIEDTVLKDYPYWASFIKEFRKICEDYSYNNLRMNIVVGDIGSRNTFDIANALKDEIKTSDEIINQEFIRNKDKDFLKFLVKALSEKYKFTTNDMIEQPVLNEQTLAKRLVMNINKKIGQ